MRPRAAAPSVPPSLARGRELLASGNYSQASDSFREHLGLHAPDKFTITVGLYCEASNVAQLVRSSGNAEELFLLRVQRGGRICYALYWGLFDSWQDAQRALDSLPLALHAAGQTPIPVSRLLR